MDFVLDFDFWTLSWILIFGLSLGFVLDFDFWTLSGILIFGLHLGFVLDFDFCTLSWICLRCVLDFDSWILIFGLCLRF